MKADAINEVQKTHVRGGKILNAFVGSKQANNRDLCKDGCNPRVILDLSRIKANCLKTQDLL